MSRRTRASFSNSCCRAAWPSMCARRPLASPEATRWMKMGGNSGAAAQCAVQACAFAHALKGLLYRLAQGQVLHHPGARGKRLQQRHAAGGEDGEAACEARGVEALRKRTDQRQAQQPLHATFSSSPGRGRPRAKPPRAGQR